MKPLRKRRKLNIYIDTVMEDILTNFGLPVFICVVLPVTIVWLVARTRQQETDRKAEIMLKAIEAGVPVDMTQFEPTKKQKGPRSIKQDLLEKLNGACITGLMGLGFLTLGILRFFNLEFGRNLFLNKFWLPAGCPAGHCPGPGAHPQDRERLEKLAGVAFHLQCRPFFLNGHIVLFF